MVKEIRVIEDGSGSYAIDKTGNLLLLLLGKPVEGLTFRTDVYDMGDFRQNDR